MKYLIIVLLLLVGCEDVHHSKRQEIATVIDQGRSESELIRYEDKELDVVCYRARDYSGLSCMRKNSTQPQQ